MDAATGAALRVLGAAAQTELSLRRRLEQRGYSPATARAAVAAAASRGYVDDGAFAQALVTRRLRRGYGRAAVAAELRSRGAGERPIADAVAGISLEDERNAALRLARQLEERELRRPDDGRRVQRIAGALRRRGLGSEAIAGALRQLGLFGGPG